MAVFLTQLQGPSVGMAKAGLLGSNIDTTIDKLVRSFESLGLFKPLEAPRAEPQDGNLCVWIWLFLGSGRANQTEFFQLGFLSAEMSACLLINCASMEAGTKTNDPIL